MVKGDRSTTWSECYDSRIFFFFRHSPRRSLTCRIKESGLASVQDSKLMRTILSLGYMYPKKKLIKILGANVYQLKYQANGWFERIGCDIGLIDDGFARFIDYI